MSDQVKQWLNELTIEEKAELCSGKDFWTTQAVERLGIPSIMMTDAIHTVYVSRQVNLTI